jgi:hypothetical protein
MCEGGERFEDGAVGEPLAEQRTEHGVQDGRGDGNAAVGDRGVSNPPALAFGVEEAARLQRPQAEARLVGWKAGPLSDLFDGCAGQAEHGSQAGQPPFVCKDTTRSPQCGLQIAHITPFKVYDKNIGTKRELHAVFRPTFALLAQFSIIQKVGRSNGITLTH